MAMDVRGYSSLQSLTEIRQYQVNIVEENFYINPSLNVRHCQIEFFLS